MCLQVCIVAGMSTLGACSSCDRLWSRATSRVRADWYVVSVFCARLRLRGAKCARFRWQSGFISDDVRINSFRMVSAHDVIILLRGRVLAGRRLLMDVEFHVG